MHLRGRLGIFAGIAVERQHQKEFAKPRLLREVPVASVKAAPVNARARRIKQPVWIGQNAADFFQHGLAAVISGVASRRTFL